MIHSRRTGGIVDFTTGVQSIPAQTALASLPGTIKFFFAHQRGFTIVAPDNAPLSADITLTPEPEANATAYTGATVPEARPSPLRSAAQPPNRSPTAITPFR